MLFLLRYKFSVVQPQLPFPDPVTCPSHKANPQLRGCNIILGQLRMHSLFQEKDSIFFRDQKIPYGERQESEPSHIAAKLASNKDV